MPSPLSRFLLAFSLLCSVVNAALPGLPAKIYGTNIGSWLVLEPWMLPQEWINMGGQQCSDCSQCIASEYAFVKAYPTTADAKFKTHWQTWFTKNDVDQLKAAGINTVRIPLGYWIVEALVNRATEFYPRGGILELQRGLADLKAAGIAVILDHHALPGVAAVNQMFAGRCTSDVQFYTQYNYHRALIWTAVMTTISHLDPNFSTVAALEAINEPIMDATQTPGYGNFQINFVQTVRAVETSLGISVPGYSFGAATENIVESAAQGNLTSALCSAAELPAVAVNPEVAQVLKDAAPIISQVMNQLGLDNFYGNNYKRRLAEQQPLVTNFMDINWQYNNPSNPAAAAVGPQGYDNHLYYSFGGVAAANEQAYLTSVCNLGRIQADSALGDSPLWFGEWGLSTQFDASDTFLRKWADAQKFSYSKGAGWIFWNFKIEISTLAGDTARQWSYFEGLKRGYLTKDPAAYNNARVCQPYITSVASNATSST